MMLIHKGVLGMVLVLAATQADAASVPFTEGFDSSASGWTDNASSSLTFNGSGGQADGGGYVSTTFNFVGQVAGGQGPVLFRATNGTPGASGNAFVGNWLTDGVTKLTAWVRHDSDVPLNYFARFANPAGFPGAVAAVFTPVLASTGPDGWTQIQFAISPSNPQFVSFEGSDFATVFGNVGRVQIGVSIPAALAGVDRVIHFDLDSVAITPEPALLGLVLVAGAAVAARRFAGAKRGTHDADEG
jgi:hypothetical protein